MTSADLLHLRAWLSGIYPPHAVYADDARRLLVTLDARDAEIERLRALIDVTELAACRLATTLACEVSISIATAQAVVDLNNVINGNTLAVRSRTP